MLVPERIEQLLLNEFPEAIEASREPSEAPVFHVSANEIVYICRFLKEHSALKFDYLMSLTAIDWPDRFEVVYHLYSIPFKHYVTLKLNADKEKPIVKSVTSVWKAANWQEREVYDMFGVVFEDHPDLRRILMDEDCEEFPLRKDYVGPGK